ncbi:MULTISPECIES: hypothetical protein [Aeromicrobium]|uniref:hypothetical protein n=1 Tax=Aeromicrobium TaxID=2040 RepID=UPI00257A0DA5|nr:MULTISPECIES: hypothetical protein [Aeromicrobium]
MNSRHSSHTTPASTPHRARPLSMLLALVIALAGLVFVAGPAQAADDAIFVKTFGVSGDQAEVVGHSWDVAVGPDGSVYVADTDHARVQVYTPDGEFLRTFALSSHPYGIDVDDVGAVYVTMGNGNVAKYASDGSQVFEVHSHTSYSGYGIAVDASGKIFVTDYNAGRIVVLNAEGAPLNSWGAYGSGPGQIMHAYGIDVDDEGIVYVPDYGNSRVQKFTTDGTYLSSLTHVGDEPMNGPLKVDVDADGRIAISEYNSSRASVLTADGDLVSSWTWDGTPYSHGTAGIAFGDDGSVYTTNLNQQGVQKHQLEPVFAAFTPQIEGSGRVGDELTVSASTSPEPASWDYAWSVGGSDEVRSTDATFTPTAADQGKTATVTVTAKGTEGELRDRTATATKAITGKVMDASAFTIGDSTPTTPPTTGDVLTLEVDEAKLPEDASGTVRWGRLDDEAVCVVPEDATASTTRPVVDGDAGAQLCARVAYEASGYEDMTLTVTAHGSTVGTFTAPKPTVDVESPVVDGTLTASVDLDDGPAGAEVTAWQWGTQAEGECTAIAGADEATFTAGVEDFEDTLCVTVKISAPHHQDAKATLVVGQVGAGAFGESPTVTIPGWTAVGVEASASVTGGDPADAERTYQWKLDGEPIEGATAATYTPKGAQRGHDLSVTVTSTARGYVADVTTSGEVEIGSGSLQVNEPAFSTVRPTVGEEISLPLDLSEAPEGAEGHWQWGVQQGEVCVAISGATSDSFTPTAAEVGEVLCVEVGVTAEGYESLSGTFLLEHPVLRGTLPVLRGVLSSTSPKIGASLTASLLSGPLPEGVKTTTTWGFAPAAADCRPSKVASSFRVTAGMAGRVVCARITVTAPGHTEWSTTLRTNVIKETAKATASRLTVRGTQAFTIRAQGLAPGQRYRISLRHQMVTGKADSYGRVVRKVRYDKGLRSAKRTIVVRGFDGKGKVTYLKKLKVTYRAR